MLILSNFPSVIAVAIIVVTAIAVATAVDGFQVSFVSRSAPKNLLQPPTTPSIPRSHAQRPKLSITTHLLANGPNADSEDTGKNSDVEVDVVDVNSVEVNEETVGNLVANDEWEGLTMELSALIRTAIVEDLKSNAREFLGKDDYKLGDFSKEIDRKIKTEVANLREKDDYEIGDLSIVVDQWAKEKTSELTGKPYETGDLSREIDSRIKKAAAEWCGKDEYQVGDLSKEMTRRVKNRLSDYLGKEYEFGDITRQVEKQRREWVKSYLGAEAAENYQVRM
jgi:hypothetical protein